MQSFRSFRKRPVVDKVDRWGTLTYKQGCLQDEAVNFWHASGSRVFGLQNCLRNASCALCTAGQSFAAKQLKALQIRPRLCGDSPVAYRVIHFNFKCFLDTTMKTCESRQKNRKGWSRMCLRHTLHEPILKWISTIPFSNIAPQLVLEWNSFTLCGLHTAVSPSFIWVWTLKIQWTLAASVVCMWISFD